MFDNIGKQIKKFAKIIFVVGLIASFVASIFISLAISDISYNAEFLSVVGFLLPIPIGFLLSWINSLFVYGFGELIDQAQEINKKLGKNDKSANTSNSQPPSITINK